MIEEFLKAHPGYFCTACLASLLNIPAGQVSMLSRRLDLAGSFQTDRAPCSACHRTRLVLKAA